MTTTILHIDASARSAGSVTRGLSARILDQLKTRHGDIEIIRRDLAEGVPFVDEAFTAAINKFPEDRSAAEAASLATSDALVADLQTADIVVIGTPIYNFGVPAVFKAWFDQVARAGITFRYTENGPVGLLEGKKAYVAMASGGTRLGSEIDFASTWLRHALGFIGIHDVELIGAGRVLADDEAVARAEEAVARIAA
ncbi:FMN-dependent NADH-azoreductase [Pyruvatibacter mobilis]|uniref:FMN-dependent NADH-azoreductase n=1 Tax=Pyruvatibacter mobilis TaxID=1712261 RepID=UPI003BAAFA22